MKIWTLFEPKHKNFKCLLKIEGSLLKCLNIKHLMSIPSPLQQYHFHVIQIWWHSPFKGSNTNIKKPTNKIELILVNNTQVTTRPRPEEVKNFFLQLQCRRTDIQYSLQVWNLTIKSPRTQTPNLELGPTYEQILWIKTSLDTNKRPTSKINSSWGFCPPFSWFQPYRGTHILDKIQY
jgi:hypothetical protein